MSSMIGYKALHKDFTACNGFKYEIGKTYELPKDEKLEICHCGFHFCANPIDVYGYYANTYDTIIVEVEALGDIVYEGTKYATDKIKIVRVYTEDKLQCLIENGHSNTGKCNTGCYNTGSYNSGSHNTANYNSGDYNTGSYNSGNCNNGDCNSGCFNTGSYNKGHYNTGLSNDGNYNAGDGNNGDCNVGCFNTGSCNVGIFNTIDHKMVSFNKECDITFTEFLKSLDYNFDTLCKHIIKNDLFPGDRERIEALPNYDPAIFTDITGIKFDECNDVEEEECNTVDVDINEVITALFNEVKSLREEIKQLKNKEE